MATSWLDLMAEDSNVSMASMASMASIKSYDTEFDNSRQGVNLLFKKNVKIISDDSQSRKRTFNEMEKSAPNIHNDNENEFFPPKAKQRTNVKGDWTKRKTQISNETEKENIGFGRFLNWAQNENCKQNNVLSIKSNDNQRNITNHKRNGNHLVICNPSINPRKRKQYRVKRRKKTIENIHDHDPKSIITKIEEEQQPQINPDTDNDNDNDNDIDVDIDIEPKECKQEENMNENMVNEKASDSESKPSSPSPLPSPSQPQQEKEQEAEQEEEEEQEEQEEQEEEEEDDDLKTPIKNFKEVKKRRITPTLENIVFDADLILNKVPILKKKDLDDESDKILNGPIFLNADQYEKLHKLQEKEEKKKEEIKQEDDDKDNDDNDDNDDDDDIQDIDDNDCDVWCSKNNNNNDIDKNKSMSWAQRLFGEKIRKNKVLKQKEEELLVYKRKQERIHEMKIDSILPPQQKQSVMFSRESSVSLNESTASLSSSSSSSSSSAITTTTATTTCFEPSSDATEWREKQILIGKATIGYSNFIKKYPNKDTRFRFENKLIATPDPKEKIGKKRWVGKFRKWRKFLHEFDDEK